MATRRKYAAEFKQEAVQLVRSANVPASQIARDLGIDPNMLSRWCREMGSVGNKAFHGQGRAGHVMRKWRRSNCGHIWIAASQDVLHFPQRQPGEDMSIDVSRNGWIVVNDIQLKRTLPGNATQSPLEILIVFSRHAWAKEMLAQQGQT